ncbi:MAG TPA: multidrug ABC transporter ATP-binding protein [Paenibacillaceae bacterium]|nr:multidrug ABC transporter ATP-binding protein [Paenibacillaceae bacterium]
MKSIEFINVKKSIKNKEILKNISVKLECGKIYGFFGRNGSGKTMLFRAVCGLIKPTSGEIHINGKTLHKDMSFPENVGVIIESPGFWEYYTGFKNLKLLASIKRKISDEQIRSSIERVGLNPDDDRVFKKYSLGMKQRLAIAQAIMEEPDLLILDEPTNALDEQGINLVRKILLEEKKRGTTILIASHNKEDIELLSDVKFRMNDGRLEQFNG